MAPRPCLTCSSLTSKGARCPRCEQAYQQARNQARPQYQGEYRTRARAVRESGLPCVWCGHPGTPDNPIVADHLDATTLVPACRRCNAKRATSAPVFGKGIRGRV